MKLSGPISLAYVAAPAGSLLPGCARRKRNAVRFASLGMVREAMNRAGAWRRHVPPAIFLLALGVAVLATARPSAMVTLPSHQRTIVLAIDVSLSMRATDVEPNRIAAAQAAAKAFVQERREDCGSAS